MDPRSLLRQFDIKPKKSLGQNFLIDEAAADPILEAAELSPHDAVLEVGPGVGTLTRCLAATVARVVAVELDQRLMPVLEHALAGYNNVELIHGDALELDPTSIMPPDYKVVANIPYYITSALLRHLLEAGVRELPSNAVGPTLMVLTVQEEVARRIVAQPGAMSLLAVSVQLYGRPRIVARLKAGAFYPRPKVNSAVLRIDLSAGPRPDLNVTDVDLFFQLAKAGFGQRRKQLRNALAHGLGRSPIEMDAVLAQAGIDPRRRAETLTLAEWAELSRAFSQVGQAPPSDLKP
jgi:16S rRNA (adenine1518-N6/adenine1519-N6)-dimethyltransferase